MSMAEYDRWLATRPPQVQALAREFPPMTRITNVPGYPTLYVVGWTEGDELIVSPIDPTKDYDGARAAKQIICAEHCR